MLSEAQVYSLFEVRKRLKPNAWQARCPCHDDKKASLTITNDDRTGKTLIRCHAGCSTRDILSRIGITFADLNDKKAEPVREPAYKKNLVAEYRYYDYENGNKYLYSKLRYKGKAIRYARIKGDDYKAGAGDLKHVLYNGKVLLQQNNAVYYCEGEKDVDSLKQLGLSAVTAGGVEDWHKKYAPLFRGKKVTIFADNDDPGRKLALRVQQDISSYAYATRIITPSNQPKGDITDYLELAADKQAALRTILDEGTYPYRLAWWVDDKGSINADCLASAFTQHNNILVAKYQATNTDIPFWYRNGVYVRTGKAEIMSALRQYYPIGKATASGLKNAADLVLSSVSRVEFDDMNVNESIINLQNGIYNVHTGRLEDHTPDLLSTIQLNLEYQPAATCPKWEAFIEEFCSDEEGHVDNEMKLYLQEVTGLILSNVYGYRVKSCLILYSSEGNTGKSVYLNILIKLLGALNVANISFQDMSRDKFATADLYGKRLNAVPDQASADLNESSTFKQLTGADPIIRGQFKGLQSFYFEFRGFIAIACNILPSFQDDKGNHLVSRLGIVHCRNVIAADMQNKHLVQELVQEAPGIFLWAMEGLQRLLANKMRLTTCSSGDAIKEEYRKRISNLYDFITDEDECRQGEKLRVRKTEFEQAYIDYCERNGYTHINRKNIAPQLEGLGVRIKLLDGYPYYQGIELVKLPAGWEPVR